MIQVLFFPLRKDYKRIILDEGLFKHLDKLNNIVNNNGS